jgi:hypothetical protein
MVLALGCAWPQLRCETPPLHKTIVARRPVHRCARHDVRTGRGAAARRGVSLGMTMAHQGSALACWGARRSPPGWRRGNPASNYGTKAGHGKHGDELSARSTTQRPPKQRWVRFLRHQQQYSTRVGKEGQHHSPWVDGGVVASLVWRTRDGEEGVRSVEVPACFYSPATASRRGSLQ